MTGCKGGAKVSGQRQWSRNAPFVALVGLLLVGCASSGKKQISPAEELHTAIEETMLDPERRAKMETLGDEYLGLLDGLVEELGEAQTSLGSLIADYGSSRQDFETFFEQYSQGRVEFADRVIEIHLAMKEIASDEEWRSLEKATQRVTTTMLSASPATVSQ